MSELPLDAGLVGQRVCNPNRPEWGTGEVLRVQRTQVNGQTVHRVSVQFATGHRQIVIPPGRLAYPEEEVTREAGWLDSISGRTVDDRLAQVPEALREMLALPADMLRAVAPLFAYTAEPDSLQTWARRQTGVADPLTHWSRDELQKAFEVFCRERDAFFRVTAAKFVKHASLPELHAALEAFPPAVQEGMREALRKPL